MGDNNYLREMATAPAFSCDKTYSLDSVIHGHHVFKLMWTPFVGEILSLMQEHDNKHDCFAVAVQLRNNKKTIERVPIKIVKAFWNFLSNGGQIRCDVTSGRKKGKGLEVPCVYHLSGTKPMVMKLKKSHD